MYSRFSLCDNVLHINDQNYNIIIISNEIRNKWRSPNRQQHPRPLLPQPLHYEQPRKLEGDRIRSILHNKRKKLFMIAIDSTLSMQ